MHEILHVLGLCPDSLAHFDLLDLIISLNSNLNHLFNYINFFLFKKW